MLGATLLCSSVCTTQYISDLLGTSLQRIANRLVFVFLHLILPIAAIHRLWRREMKKVSKCYHLVAKGCVIIMFLWSSVEHRRKTSINCVVKCTKMSNEFSSLLDLHGQHWNAKKDKRFNCNQSFVVVASETCF